MCVTLAVDRLASWLTHVSAEEGSIEQGARVTTELDRHSVYCLHRCKVIDRLIPVSAEEGSIERGARVTKELDRHSVYSRHGCKAIQRLASRLSRKSAEERSI